MLAVGLGSVCNASLRSHAAMGCSLARPESVAPILLLHVQAALPGDEETAAAWATLQRAASSGAAGSRSGSSRGSSFFALKHGRRPPNHRAQ